MKCPHCGRKIQPKNPEPYRYVVTMQTRDLQTDKWSTDYKIVKLIYKGKTPKDAIRKACRWERRQRQMIGYWYDVRSVRKLK